ncbi:MAG TPA: hypothetical protein VFU23_06610 [Gemmatimonadales bacterium]|nr:hypothetical protein [Gemmatimonadales bacterium]
MRMRILLAALLVGSVRAAPAQTPADTASVILQVARDLQRDGRPDAARELFRYLRDRYRATPAGRAADSLMHAMPGTGPIGNGRTGFVTFNTVYGAFLGSAIPAAFDAHGGGAYGVGLLIGAPAGFFASRAFARAHFRSAGQAGIASFATAWGTWQGLGIQRAFNIGEEEICATDFCYRNDSQTAPWALMSVGGVVGIAAGWALASAKDVRPGTATMISHSALWGSWFGVSVGRAAGLHDDNLWASTLIVGNAALLAAIPAARAWQPTSSRVRLISAAGLAGGLAGFGIDLIANPDDDKVVFAIPAMTSAAGLLVGALATKHQSDLDTGAGGFAAANAVVQWKDGLRFTLALPEPAAFRIVDRTGQARTVRGARLRLFDATF